jgi:hypothetical protein
VKELELKSFLELSQQTNHGLAMRLGISPQKMHAWKKRNDCYVKFGDNWVVTEINLRIEKKVYER